jgi:hypothetical protein
MSMHDLQQPHIPAEPFTSQVMVAVETYEARRKQRQALLNRVLMISAPLSIVIALVLLGESGVAQIQASFTGILGGGAGSGAWMIVGACLLAQASLALLMTRADDR